MSKFRVQYKCVDRMLNTTLPGASVTVYDGDSTTRSIIYGDDDGSLRANPMTADAEGFVDFWLEAGGDYQMVVTLGTYVSPRLVLGPELAGITVYGSETLAAIYAAGSEVFGVMAAAPSSAVRLLGLEDYGRAFDFMGNSSAERGVSGLTANASAFTWLTHSRAGVGPLVTSEGFFSSVAAGVKSHPFYDPSTGKNAGIHLCQPLSNLFWAGGDVGASVWGRTNCSVSVSSLTSPFLDNSPVWTHTGTSTTAFSTLALNMNGQSVLDVASWYTAIVAIHQSSTAERIQLKPTLNGGAGADIAGNVTFDLKNCSVMDSLSNSEGFIQRMGEWIFCAVSVLSVDHVGIQVAVSWDLADVAFTRTIHTPEFIVHKSRGLELSRLPIKYQKRTQKLTSAKWNALTGSPTIGTFTATNKITNLAFSGAGWVNTSVAAPVAIAGAAVDGTAAYVLDDTDAGASGNYRYTTSTGAIGVSDYLYTGMFVYMRAESTTDQFSITPNILPVTTVGGRFSVFTEAMKGYLAATTGGSGYVADVAEVEGIPNVYLVVIRCLNNGVAGNTQLRSFIYPQYNNATGQGNLVASHPFMIPSASATLWDFTTEEQPADVMYETIGSSPWSPLSGTMAVDIGRLTTPQASGDDHYLIHAVKNSDPNNFAISLILKNNAGTPTLIGRFTKAGVTTEVTAAIDDVAPGRYAITWGSGLMRITKDRLTVAETFLSPPTVLGIDRIYIGCKHDSTGQPNTTFASFWRRIGDMNADQIYQVGRTPLRIYSMTEVSRFTESEIGAAESRMLTARASRLARVRNINFVKYVSAGFYIEAGVGQSFIRAANAAVPTLTDAANVATRAYATGAWMYGGSVRGAATTGLVFSRVTDGGVFADQLYQLAATVDSGDALVTSAEVTAAGGLAPSTSYVGQTPNVSKALEFRARHQLTADTSRNIVVFSNGSTDSSLADISNPTLTPHCSLKRLEDYLDKVKAKILSQFASSNVKLSSISVYHGQASYTSFVSETEYIYGGTTETYNGAMAFFDYLANLNVTKFGTSERPVFTVCIPDMHWGNDQVVIAEAYTKMERLREDLVITSVSSMFQPSGASDEHNTSWGTLCSGLHDALGDYYLRTLNQNYFIPEPYEILQKGDELLISVQAMDYPLRYMKTFGYYSNQPADIPNWGFRPLLKSQPIGIKSIEILADRTGMIRIVMDSAPDEPVRLDYAGKLGGINCRGNVYDSGAPFTRWPYQRPAVDSDPTRDLTAYYASQGITHAPGNRQMRPFARMASMVV